MAFQPSLQPLISSPLALSNFFGAFGEAGLGEYFCFLIVSLGSKNDMSTMFDERGSRLARPVPFFQEKTRM